MPRAADATQPVTDRVPETVRTAAVYDPGPERLVLLGVAGPGAGLEFMLSRPVSILGRGPGASLVLQDPSASRRHLKLVLVADPVRPAHRLLLCQDLQSTNGLRVNGRKVKRKLLRGGEKILVGRTVFRFERRDSFDAAFYGRLQQLATTDALTGVGNRLALTQELERQDAERERYGRPYSVLLTDLDDFKDVNDHRSHAAGDQVLREVASIILANLRGSDRAFRYGGDEFVAILAETDGEGAAVVAERIRSGIESTTVRYAGEAIRVTASIGVAEASDDDILTRADRALYKAKRAGRNCVRRASGREKR
jgi:diguanylate cyclase (GGDEF)-like protein